MHKRKDVLTTGQVAQICNVAPRTVTKWFDSGQLKGYRIPGSRDRRIPTSELIRFMKAHDMPTEGLELGTLRVLVIDSDFSAADHLAHVLSENRGYETFTATNSFDSGLAAQKLMPHVILVNMMSQGVDAMKVSQYVRSNDDLNGTSVIAIANHLKDSEAQALEQKGFDGVIQDSGNLKQVVQIIESATSILY